MDNTEYNGVFSKEQLAKCIEELIDVFKNDNKERDFIIIISEEGKREFNRILEEEAKGLLIYELRKISGFGVMICKKCLEDYNWDFEKARKEINLHNKYTHTKLLEIN